MTALIAARNFAFNIFLDADRPQRGAVEAYEGDDLSIVFTVRDRKGARMDLTGVTATYEIARKGDGCGCGLNFGAVVEKTVADGVTINAVLGTVTVAVNVGDDLPAAQYADQLKLAKDGKRLTTSAGAFNIKRSIPA